MRGQRKSLKGEGTLERMRCSLPTPTPFIAGEAEPREGKHLAQIHQ